MGRRRLSVFFALLVLLGAREASASFHLMQVVEVYPGSPAAPGAQYVVLQMYFGGQNFVGGTSIAIYNASNAELGRFTFPASVANGATQAKILVATSQAQAFFNLTPNLTMTNILPLAGGKVCFESGAGGSIDCVAWGNHPGSAAGGGAGNVGPPVSPVLGLRPGRAIVRRLDTAGGATTLDAGDDTNHSANNWRIAIPAPRNNAGQSGVIPPAVCGNGGAPESIESCDDGNTNNNDGCDAMCLAEACGDTITNGGGETCDDGNLVSGDGCDVTCKVTGCGSGVVTAGEQCDDGNLVSGDGCDSTCRPTGCGSGVVTLGEQCDDGNLTSGDGCDSNCTPTGCGNGIVTMGEDCDPPGVNNCGANCQLGCVTNGDCADSDPCTTNEHCDATSNCSVDPVPTDDGESCTVDSCGPGGVVHDPQADGSECTLAPPGTRTLCVAGVCGESRCGDGYTDVGAAVAEECDDGNPVDTDACTTDCTLARCGDGHVQGAEQCDDGNDVDTDACISVCEDARCGDGFVQTPESCDDGNETSGDGCTGACAQEFCGDGVEQLGEQCDDGNDLPGDGCSAACETETPAPPDDDGGGCCGTGSGGGGASSAILAVLALLGVLGRRRRSILDA